MDDRILMIEDDASLSQMVADYLSGFGMQITIAPTISKGREQLTTNEFDALLLDVMLPDGDGFDMCREVRSTLDIPILMLTARGEDTDRIVGLELGADDYLPKPFNPRELVARLRAILRRRQPAHVPGERVLRFGNLEIDRDARSLRIDGEERALTGYQFDLLVALADHAGRVMSREALMDQVRGEELDAFDRSIDVHISRIRAAIEDDPKHPRRIVTVRGAGYVFARDQGER
ncbi:MAG: response regulator transcription factor [Betaproteobacteria bacterium]|nr:MAG: response regulator transcription factor [Betaproteobacteria bacterium]